MGKAEKKPDILKKLAKKYPEHSRPKVKIRHFPDKLPKKIEITMRYPFSQGDKCVTYFSDYGRFITSPTTGRNYELASNQEETIFNCGVDETPLIVTCGGYGEKKVSCVECGGRYGLLIHLGTQEQINEKAKSHLEYLVKKNESLIEETGEKLEFNNWVLELAQKKNKI